MAAYTRLDSLGLPEPRTFGANGISRRGRVLLGVLAITAFILVFFRADIGYSGLLDNAPDLAGLLTVPSTGTRQVLAVLAASPNPRYLFTLPFAVAAWRRLGADSVVLLIGTESEFRAFREGNETLEMLRALEAQTLFVPSAQLARATMSQVIRLFPAAMPFTASLPEDTVLVTSDADLVVFHLENHAPNVSQGWRLHLYNSKCCRPVRVPPMRGKDRVPMYPMGTLGATLKTWREIMGFSRYDFSGKDIEEYLKTEFGQSYFHPNDDKRSKLVGSALWYSDQSLASYKIDQWLHAASEHRKQTSETTRRPRRIDRIAWPALSKFAEMRVEDWDDAHLSVAGYTDAEWYKMEPFVEFAFRGDELLIQNLKEYRQRYIAQNGSPTGST